MEHFDVMLAIAMGEERGTIVHNATSTCTRFALSTQPSSPPTYTPSTSSSTRSGRISNIVNNVPVATVLASPAPHPLQLKRSCTEFRCSACLEWRAYRFKYSCTRCGLDFDQSCIMKQSIMGLTDEVRQKCTEHKITVLPVANLISSYAPTQDPPTPSNDLNPLVVPISIIQIISEI
ncbi:Vacuolar protein sorting-associated protein 27 [Bienertia sinuspersici]